MADNFSGRYTGYFRASSIARPQVAVKSYISLIFLILALAPAVAQTIDTKKVNDLLAKRDYIGAMREWAAVKRELQAIASAELKKVIPQAVGELKLQANVEQQADVQGGLTLTVLYLSPPQEALSTDPSRSDSDGRDLRMIMGMPSAQPSIQLTVTTNLMIANEVIMAHGTENNAMRNGDGSKSEAIRIKGFRALLRTDPDLGTTAQMIVGGAYIRAEGRGMKDSKAVMDLLNSIDTEQLKKIVGE